MSTLDQQSFLISLDLLAREEADPYRKGDGHPTPEELAAYHSGELSESQDTDIQLHLVACSECPDLLIDLEDLFDQRHRDLDLSDTWISAAWRDLRAKLGNQPAQIPFWRRWFSWFSAVPRPAYALATGLMFFLLVGGTAQISSLRQELARPVGQIPDVVLSTSRGPSEDSLPVRFPAGVNRVRLSLRLLGSSQPIQAEFWDNEKLLWRIPVNLDQKGRAYIEISRRSLDPGEYELKLSSSKYKVAYPIQIVHL